jgi:hypothetical protein
MVRIIATFSNQNITNDHRKKLIKKAISVVIPSSHSLKTLYVYEASVNVPISIIPAIIIDGV